MGGPPPRSDDDPRAKIVLSGWHDWVSLGEARYLVGTTVSAGTTAVDLRATTLAVVDDLLQRGLVLAGDLSRGFTAWQLDPSSSSRWIAGLWTDPDDRLLPGDVCWLATTPAGDELADRIHGGAPFPP